MSTVTVFVSAAKAVMIFDGLKQPVRARRARKVSAVLIVLFVVGFARANKLFPFSPGSGFALSKHLQVVLDLCFQDLKFADPCADR